VPSKRERDLARAKFARQQERRSHRRVRNRFISVVVLGLLFIGTIGFVTYQNQPDQIAADPSASAPEVPEAPVSISTNAPIPGCQEPAVVRADNITYGNVTSDLPTASEFSLETNCGVIKLATDPNAPTTVGTIAWLANQGFYNNTSCHRLTTQGIFVLQCGDPAGDGTGSPGFTFADENLPTAGADGTYVYPRGTVAMANRGANTNSSQFFLVYQDSPLPPNYSVWGQITEGLDVIDNVASAGVLDGSSDGLPSQAVVISKASTTP
jgi:peptidyl-prolyl cis-trans isomerase B (cyclophilin B)